MVIERKMTSRLVKWKENNGGTALLVVGAKSIGKSFTVEEFAKKEYRSYILVDFSDFSEVLRDIFENDKNNLNTFFSKLSVYFSVDLYDRESLIIFDEVQLYPKARQMIKHLVKDGRYDYIETGSLLSIKQNTENILLPSEEESIKMFPLDFEEFCWATNNKKLYEYIKESYSKMTTLGQAIHRQAMDLFRQYILVGGMPQSVVAYLESNKFSESDKIKRRIIDLYRNDISRYAKGYQNKVLSIFDDIPAQLSRHEKKFKLSSLSKQAKFRDYEDSFVWLSEAMITNVCFNSTDPSVGLKLYTDRLTLKTYFCDTGLLISHCFAEERIATEGIYKEILFGKLEINEGMIMENVVAQLLRSSGHSLYFYSRVNRGDAHKDIEVDFIIRSGNKICPLEVKSSKRYTYKSLAKFYEKFKSRIDKVIILHIQDLRVEDGITYLRYIWLAFYRLILLRVLALVGAFYVSESDNILPSQTLESFAI